MKKINELIVEYIRKQEDIISAYLFGSFARGKENKFSDLDIAVYFDSSVVHSELADRQINMITDISKLVRREVDIIALNNASISLRFKIIQTGRCFYEKDILLNRRFVADSMIQYYDFLPIKNLIESRAIDRFKKE